YDCQLFWDPQASPSPWHGVTTVVMGNCGFTIAPCREADRETLMQLLLFVEGMPIETLRAGIAWAWEDFGGYLGALEGRGAGPSARGPGARRDRDRAAHDHRTARRQGRGAALVCRAGAREREGRVVGAAPRQPLRARERAADHRGSGGASGTRRAGGAPGG